jgi:hypothetical protein
LKLKHWFSVENAARVIAMEKAERVGGQATWRNINSKPRSEARSKEGEEASEK